MKFLSALLLLLLFTNCYEFERNCTEYQTGDFRSEIEINGKTYVSTFNRSKDLQIETYNKKTDSSKLRWINDCEVIFTTINPKSMAAKKDVHLKILTTTDSTYTFEYSYVGEVTKQKGVAYKVD
ncbi:DNA topoisomerase IV [Aurantibacter sp.]|uniref:DNA topoisomerase IV n=1 Tax=Aurantibacter sp. TaxID=2807103 RepID=UPI0035C7C916